MVSYVEKEFENFGRCLWITNGGIEAVVTLDVGPRVIRFGFVGGQNLFVTQPDRGTRWSGPAFDAYYGKGSVSYAFGGHRIWVTPERAPETYYPDNDPVAWAAEGDRFRFTPPPQRGNGIQLELSLRMDPEKPVVEVENAVTNVSDGEKEFAVWTVSAMNLGGLAFLPHATDKTGYLPNRTLSLWPYTDASDARFFNGRQYLSFRQDPQAKGSFKMGTNNRAGRAAYLLNGEVFGKQTAPHDPGRRYPDGGVSFETYLSPCILEMETLGPVETVSPGQRAALTETWSLTRTERRPEPGDEASLDALWQEIW